MEYTTDTIKADQYGEVSDERGTERGVNTVQEYNIEEVYARSRGYCRRFHEY